MKRSIISFVILLNLLVIFNSCDQKDSVSPSTYFIDIEGKEGDKVNITYVVHQDEEIENQLISKDITLPYYYKAVEYRNPSKNSIRYPSLELTNTTSDSITVLVVPQSGEKAGVVEIDGKKYNLSIVLEMLRFETTSTANPYPEIKDLTIDSLYTLLKRINHPSIRTVYKNESVKLEIQE